MKNRVKTVKRKIRRSSILGVIVFVLAMLFFNQIIPFNDTETGFIVFLTIFSGLFGLVASMLRISFVLQDVEKIKSNVRMEAFKHYLNSCLKAINDGDIEKAKRFYNDGLIKDYYKRRIGYKERALILRGAIRHMDGSIKECNYENL